MSLKKWPNGQPTVLMRRQTELMRSTLLRGSRMQREIERIRKSILVPDTIENRRSKKRFSGEIENTLLADMTQHFESEFDL